MKPSRKLSWVFFLYFLEGLPFGIFNDLLPVYLRLHGVSLRDLSHLNLAQLPWSLKVLWAPLVDRLGQPMRWVTGALTVLAAVLLCLGLLDKSGNSVAGGALLLLLLALATASATQDLAIDGYFVRLVSPAEAGTANGVRVAAFRTAMITCGGGLVLLAGLLGNWQHLFFGVAGLLACLSVVVAWAPRVPQKDSGEPQSFAAWAQALLRWARQPDAFGVFAFVLLYRLGDTAMSAMVKPFWVDRGMQATEIGLLTTVVGVGVTVVGAALGGLIASRVGTLRALWLMGMALALSNLGYAWVAFVDAGRPALYAVSLLESLTQTLATTAQMIFFTRICDKQHAATQFALFTALAGLTRALAGKASGIGAESLGFAGYFFVTFLLSFPAYCFYPAIKRRLAAVDAAADG
jgi:PAT family beta-lactamase induction signal transducer AmpG